MKQLIDDLPVLTSSGFTLGTMIISDSVVTAVLNASVTLCVACLTVYLRERKTNPTRKPQNKTHEP